jgi:hypothetical protein
MCLEMQLIIRTREDVAEQGETVGCGRWPARESLSAKNNDSHFRQLTETCPPSFTIICHHDALGNRQCLVPDHRTVINHSAESIPRGKCRYRRFYGAVTRQRTVKVRWSVSLHASANYFLNNLSSCSLTQEEFLQVSISRAKEMSRKIDAGRKCKRCVAYRGIRGRSPECGNLLREYRNLYLATEY